MSSDADALFPNLDMDIVARECAEEVREANLEYFSMDVHTAMSFLTTVCKMMDHKTQFDWFSINFNSQILHYFRCALKKFNLKPRRRGKKKKLNFVRLKRNKITFNHRFVYNRITR